MGRSHNLGMIRQPKIVVRAQIQHRALIEQTNVGLLRRIYRSFRFKQSLTANRFQFRECVFEKCGQEKAPTIMIRESIDRNSSSEGQSTPAKAFIHVQI